MKYWSWTNGSFGHCKWVFGNVIVYVMICGYIYVWKRLKYFELIIINL